MNQLHHPPILVRSVKKKRKFPTSNLPRLLSIIEEPTIASPRTKPSGFDVLLDAIIVTKPSPTVQYPISMQPCLEQMSSEESRWLHCKIITIERLNQLLTSTLVIHVSPGQVIKLEANPVEIYSADLLKNRSHGRRTVLVRNSPNDNSTAGAEMIIRSNHLEYNDPLDRLHVIRQHSSVFSEYARETKTDIIGLLRFCLANGEQDLARRCENMHRVVNIGCKPELHLGDEPVQVNGSKYFKNMTTEDENDVKNSIGSIVDLIWASCQHLQIYKQNTKMGGDNQRRDKYGMRVSKFIHAVNSEFENVSCVVSVLFSVLYPISCQGNLHYDNLNDTTPGYTRTGCMDFIMEDADRTVYLLQVLGNF